MFVLKSTHQKALAEIESLKTQLELANKLERNLNTRLDGVRGALDNSRRNEACLTALCQYLPEGTYSVIHAYTALDDTITHSGTSVTVDHKAAKMANRNYTIKHEPLPVDVQRILVGLQRNLKQTMDAYAKVKQEQLAASYLGLYEKVVECGFKRAALSTQIVCLKQKIKLIELELS